MKPPPVSTDRRSLEPEAAMLPQDLPPRFTRFVAWLLIALFASALLGATLVRIPETIRCPCVLVPQHGADPLQSPRQAVISEVRAGEGQEVAAGAVLFVLRSDEIRDAHTQLQTSLQDLSALEDRRAKLETAHTAQLAIKNAEITQVERELGYREKHTDTNKDRVARMEKLYSQGLLSELENLRYKLALAESDKDLMVTQKTLQQVKLEREKLETDRARQRTEEQAEAEKLKARLAALKQTLENTEDDRLLVRAPFPAVVLSLARRTPGDVVRQGEELCQLARPDGDLRARIALSEEAVPRVAPRQPVRFFLDAFPYQRFGTITGTLEWISPAAVTLPEGRRFIAKAALDQTGFRMRGEPRPVRVGMKGEARIIIGRRTLVEYAFEPIRQLRENLRP